MHFAINISRAQGDDTVISQQVVAIPDGRVSVDLRGEHEGRKWPLKSVGQVDEAVLRAYTSKSRDAFVSLADTGTTNLAPKDDCLRTLFSTFGLADPAKEIPKGLGVIALAGGHDGQMWRIRAVTGGRVEERLVRFTGDGDHLFAVVSQEDYALGEMPTCTQLTNRP